MRNNNYWIVIKTNDVVIVFCIKAKDQRLNANSLLPYSLSLSHTLVLVLCITKDQRLKAKSLYSLQNTLFMLFFYNLLWVFLSKRRFHMVKLKNNLQIYFHQPNPCCYWVWGLFEFNIMKVIFIFQKLTLRFHLFYMYICDLIFQKMITSHVLPFLAQNIPR